MKIVDPNATLIKHDIDPYKFIEKVGRTCYKSESNITDDSATKFVNNLASRKHYAMLEHEYVYFIQEFKNIANLQRSFSTLFGYIAEEHKEMIKYINLKTQRNQDYAESHETINAHTCLVSGSFRAFMEFFDNVSEFYSGKNDMKSKFLRQLCSECLLSLHAKFPELFKTSSEYGFEDPEKLTLQQVSRDKLIERIKNDISINVTSEDKDRFIKGLIPHTVLFICDRGVSHEFVRHRPASYGQESTRYCNYTLGKNDSEIKVIRPMFYKEGDVKFDRWEASCLNAERTYFDLVESGSTPQEARSVLPNSLKTEIFITAIEDEWQHIINLRYHGKTGAPHPQMKEVMTIAYPQLVEASDGRLE